MRKLFFVLFMSVAIFAKDVDISFNKELNINKELKSMYIKFWNLYSKKDVENMYKMESPHFKYLYDKNGYEGYVKMINSPKSIEAIKVTQDDKKFVIYTKLVLENGQMTFLEDTWLLVDDSFYHHSQILLMFSE